MTDKNHIEAISANLKALGANNKTKVQANGINIDYTNLSSALSGENLKGKVKIDVEGDGIFDKQIKAKALNKVVKNPESLFKEAKSTRVDTNTAKDYAAKLIQIDEDKAKSGISKKDLKTVNKNEDKILHEFRKGGFTPEQVVDLEKRVKAEKAGKEKPETAKTPAKAPDKKAEEKPKYTEYTVQNGDDPNKIADRFKIAKDKREQFKKELVALNKGNKRAYDRSKLFIGKTTHKKVDGFLVGAKIRIPGDFVDQEKNMKLGTSKEEIAKYEKKYGKQHPVGDRKEAKTEHKSEHKVEHKVEHKAEHKADVTAKKPEQRKPIEHNKAKTIHKPEHKADAMSKKVQHADVKAAVNNVKTKNPSITPDSSAKHPVSSDNKEPFGKINTLLNESLYDKQTGEKKVWKKDKNGQWKFVNPNNPFPYIK